MRGGPGRVLPSVIVGGLLVGGLALGTGVAAAAAGSCTDGATKYDISQSHDGRSGHVGELPAEAGRRGDGAGGRAEGAPEGARRLVRRRRTAPTPPTRRPWCRSPRRPPGRRRRPRRARSTTTALAGPARRRPSARPVRGTLWRPPSWPLPPSRRPASSPGRPRSRACPSPRASRCPARPGCSHRPRSPGAPCPAGSPRACSAANFGNPALLAGTPLGAAATSLFAPQADSAVTTVSHSEALASGAPRGVGTPTAIAAIALACVVGILVRSRVLRRIAARERMAGVLVDDPAGAEPTPADAAAADDSPRTTTSPPPTHPCSPPDGPAPARPAGGSREPGRSARPAGGRRSAGLAGRGAPARRHWAIPVRTRPAGEHAPWSAP